MAEITKQQLDTLNDLLKRLTDNLDPGTGKRPGDPLRNSPSSGDIPNPVDAKTTREQIRAAVQQKDIAEEHLRILETSAEVQNDKRKYLEDNLAILNEEEQILLNILNGDEDAIKNQREKLVQSKKILKVHEDLNEELDEINDKYRSASATGEELAKSMGRMLGMSEPKRGGISDVISNISAGGERAQLQMAGLQKGLASTFTAGNLLISGFQKLAEVVVFASARFDKMSSEFAKATGTGRKYVQQTKAASEATQGLIANQGQLLESSGKLQNALAGVGGISRDQASTFAEIQMATEKLGVSSEDFTEIIQQQMLGLGKTSDEAKQSFANMQAAADSMGMTFGDLTSQFRANAGTFAAFGGNMEKVFLRTAGVARQLGLELSSVIQLGTKFDTFDGAASSVADLNYIMGGQFLDTMEMMSIQAEEGPEGVTRAIKEQLDASGKSFDEFSYHQRKAMAEAMGLSEGDLQKVMNGTIDVDGLQGATEATQDLKNLTKLANETMGVMEKLATIFVGAIDSMMSSFNLDKLVDNISGLVDGSAGFGKVASQVAIMAGTLGTMTVGAGLLFKKAKSGKGILGGIANTAMGALKGFKKGGLKGALGGAVGGLMGGEGTGKLGTASNPMFVKIVGRGSGAGAETSSRRSGKFGDRGVKKVRGAKSTAPGKHVGKKISATQKIKLEKMRASQAARKASRVKPPSQPKVPNVKVHSVADQAAKSGINKALPSTPKKPGLFGRMKGFMGKNASKLLNSKVGGFLSKGAGRLLGPIAAVAGSFMSVKSQIDGAKAEHAAGGKVDYKSLGKGIIGGGLYPIANIALNMIPGLGPLLSLSDGLLAMMGISPIQLLANQIPEILPDSWMSSLGKMAVGDDKKKPPAKGAAAAKAPPVKKPPPKVSSKDITKGMAAAGATTSTVIGGIPVTKNGKPLSLTQAQHDRVKNVSALSASMGNKGYDVSANPISDKDLDDGWVEEEGATDAFGAPIRQGESRPDAFRSPTPMPPKQAPRVQPRGLTTRERMEQRLAQQKAPDTNVSINVDSRKLADVLTVMVENVITDKQGQMP